jgi:mannose/cellobiose epimerase-like protein (N-acyl-D-glucosamine 2-epimerase family)
MKTPGSNSFEREGLGLDSSTGTSATRSWLRSPAHRAWLLSQALRHLDFYRALLGEAGHFVDLDDDGQPMRAHGALQSMPEQSLLTVARAVHSYALGELLGVPGCRPIVDRGLDALWNEHRDTKDGGYFQAVDATGPVDSTKSAYNHAFVLLAASSALAAGHDARLLYHDALAVIDEHFWSEDDGASRESFTSNWDEREPYRGANSNMHMCEAFLAAADSTGNGALAERAARIARLLIDGHARLHGWMLPEHYYPKWQPRLGHNRDRDDDPFRPYGVTIGHMLEWSRLVLATWIATGEHEGWMREAAGALFGHAVDIGWDNEHGGLTFTVDWDGSPVNPDHYCWPIAEGIGASAFLLQLTGDALYERWYRKFWDFAGFHLIDHVRGGWYVELDPTNRPKVGPWSGKPDLYHVLQSYLLPLLPPAPSVAGALRLAQPGL